jgi:hypothetical protein
MSNRIGLVKQEGKNQVNVYDEDGLYMASIMGELVGFTNSTVSVKTERNSDFINVYDGQGLYLFSK